jgi:hypothetical protein
MKTKLTKGSLKKLGTNSAKLSSGKLDDNDSYANIKEIMLSHTDELSENLFNHVITDYSEANSLEYEIPEDINSELEEFIETVREYEGIEDKVDLDRLKDDILFELLNQLT